MHGGSFRSVVFYFGGRPRLLIGRRGVEWRRGRNIGALMFRTWQELGILTFVCDLLKGLWRFVLPLRR